MTFDSRPVNARKQTANHVSMSLKDLQLANMDTGRTSMLEKVLDFQYDDYVVSNETVSGQLVDILHTNSADQCDPMSSVYSESDTSAFNRWMRLTASVAKQVVTLSACVDEYSGNNVWRCYKFVYGNVCGALTDFHP